MIGKAVKNYFVNLKYCFTPLGTLALGLILGLSVLIPGAKAALEILVSSVQTTLESAEIDVEHLEQSLVAAVRALDWSDPFGSIATMFGEEWLTDTLNNSILPFVENAEIYAEELLLSIEAFTLSLVALIIIAAVRRIQILCGCLDRSLHRKRTLRSSDPCLCCGQINRTTLSSFRSPL